MMDLQILGLGNLTGILRGAVRIQKNPRLCYVDTIDWAEITGSIHTKSIITENRLSAHCPLNCPQTDKGRREEQFCWSSTQRQNRKNRSGTKCKLGWSYDGQCCHSECLGGCEGQSATDCFSCKSVVYNGRCLQKCPSSTYLYMSWRCISEEECKNGQKKYGNESLGVYWKPFEGLCAPECPAGYVEKENDKHSCEKCDGPCPKICPETTVDSLEGARKLHGCTHINGSLTIQIEGANNVANELEKNLGMIKDIKNYLKIARCYPILSLNFLKDLEIIHGEEVTSKGYSFIVLDNVNLEELWDWKHRKSKLRIKNGTLSFHFNPKLCSDKIREMEQYAEIPGWKNISLESNGHRVACEIKVINITVQKTSSALCILHVTNYHRVLSDPRSLLSYVAYYREAQFQNLTTYGGRDACGTDSWKAMYVEEEEVMKNPKQNALSPPQDADIPVFISGLKPFTQYAVYARTLTVASGLEAAHSPIIYFVTKPDTPSPPTELKAFVKLENAVVVTWKPSKRPNGIVTHYSIKLVKEYDPVEFISQRNYCEESFILSDVKKQVEETVPTTTPVVPTVNTTSITKSPTKKKCCNCSEVFAIGADEAEDRMQFEDYLQNTAFVKNTNTNTNTKVVGKRETEKNSSHFSYNSSEPINSNKFVGVIGLMNSTNVMNLTESEKPTEPVKTTESVNATESVKTNESRNSTEKVSSNRTQHHLVKEAVFTTSILHHFTEYTFRVQACHTEVYAKTSDSYYECCSAEAITTIRTLPNDFADDVNSTSVKIDTENATSGIVYIKWDEPSDPNGLLVSHHIEYRNMDSKTDKAIPICITHQKFQAYGGYRLSELSAGNYSLRIRATSLAGNGNWTSPKYFYIPESKESLTKVQLIVIIVCCFGLIALCIFIGGWFLYKKKNSIPEGVLYTSVNPEYISAALVYEPDEWEVDREKISLLRELGQGSFGMVYEGEAREIIPGEPITKCAIKTVNESASAREKIEFLQEASVMKGFNCSHVVKLLGVVSKGQPVLVIMELMACGDLKTYLRSHRPEENPDSQPPTLKQTLQMALQIADGMAYLTAKKFVHRDLAARNCMVAEDLTVKIGDFGMTRDIYENDYYRKGGKGLLPVRWMAPESLQDGIFTSLSDVWSYGVVIWEMTTLASQPYQGLSNEQVLKYVMHGGVMEMPEDCPEILFDLMTRCWNFNPSRRPSFNNIIEELICHVLTPQFKRESFYFSQSEMLPAESPSNESLLASNFGTEMDDLRYFPGPVSKENKCQNSNKGASCESEGLLNDKNSSEQIQEEQVNNSDGSKGSKISDTSNGHIYFPTSRTTEC